MGSLAAKRLLTAAALTRSRGGGALALLAQTRGGASLALALRAGAARSPAAPGRRADGRGSSSSSSSSSSSRRRGVAATVALAGGAAAGCEAADDREALIAGWEAKQGEHAWLEEVSGDAALGWAKAQNEATFAALGDPAASPTYGRILEVLESREKIPGVSKIGDFYYNFWTDEANPRGLLRRVPSLEAFRSEDPQWETVLDVDALGRAEGESWVYKGSVSCREYDENHRLVGSPTRTLVSLSPGGSDAIVRREFDLAAKAFVGGDAFELLDPSKSRCSWLDRDTLFLGADLKDGDLTSSGYPRTVREWARGTDPGDAPVVFEGEASDVSVGGYVSRSRGAAFEWRYRATTFYTTKKQVRRHGAARDGVWHRLDALGLPDDARVSHLGDQLLVEPRSDLVAGGTTYPAGSYLAVGFDDFVARGVRGATFEPLFVPTAKTSLAAAAATRDRLVLTILDNVRTRLVFLEPVEARGATTWRDAGSEAAPMIRGVSASPVDAEESNAYFLRTSTYLEPSTLALADAAAGAAGVADAEVIKALPAMFDAAGKEAFQGEATSADGTKIPFFCVRTAGAPPETPCLLYGYGGFEISNTPGYGGAIGAGWLERGATYVVANIRGGGEFGPKWHQAAKREKRHVCVDDFAAVARHLAATGVATPQSIGVRGGSNGGLLVGNFMVRHPDLCAAVVCAVPLLDMKRYSHLLAGASWRGEYGDPDTDDWAFLKYNSPYHNVRPGTAFPKLLVTTSTKDDRVHPYHARSFVKRLQETGAPNIFYYENMEGGHGGAADAKQSAFVTALYQDFLFDALSPKK